MTTDYKTNMWCAEGLWDAGWPVPFPVGIPVVVPSAVALWALRTFPLVGGADGRPVIRIGREVFVLSFASTGQWWVVRLEVTA